VSAEADLVTQLGRSFPSLSGAEGAGRVESLGLYTASVWKAGVEGLRSRGVEVPAPIYQALVPNAGQVSQTRQGGTTFLCHLRKGMADDAKYVGVIRTLATLYANAASARHQAEAQVLAGSHQNLDLSASGVLQALPPELPGDAAAAAVESLGPGSTIAGYEILDQLGAGAMGRVFKARQASLDRLVALKVLNPSLAMEDPTFVDRLQAEAKAGAKLAHQNVVGVIDQGKCPRSGIQYVAFEFVDGVTAKALLAQRPGGVMPEGEALALALAVADALGCAESHNMIHRDVKPENILIGRDGIPKLADLGLAKARREREDESQDPEGVIIGTPQFMSPEQALGVDECDIRADLFSLGITIFRLVTGRFPYESDSVIGIMTLQMTNDVPDPRTLNPKVGAGTAQVVRYLCAREREDRYPTAKSASLDLRRVLSAKAPLGPKEAHSQSERGTQSGEIQVRASFAGLEAVEVEDAPPSLDEPGQAVWRYEQSGNPKYLEDALRLYQQVEASTVPSLSATGKAGQGRVFLLQGELDRAEKLARFAFQDDPGCRPALEVIADGERYGQGILYRVDLNRMSSLLAEDRTKAAADVHAHIAREHPKEPYHHLILAVLAHQISNDGKSHLRSVQLAWALYPSSKNPDLRLGHGMDVACVDLLVDYGRGALLSNNPSLMAHSVQGTDDKTNLFAGALKMAIGLCYARLSQEVTPLETKQLRLSIARALTGLQYFDAARSMLGSVGQFPPNAVREAALLKQEKGRIQRYLASKNSAIRPQAGAYPCAATRLLKARLEGRRKKVQKYCTEQEQELVELKVRIGKSADEIGDVREEIQAAAIGAGLDDPFEPIDALRAELAATEAELEQAASEDGGGGGGGFLGMLKGAAKKAGGMAKQGQLKLKLKQVQGKLDAACKVPGEIVIEQLTSHEFSVHLKEEVRRGRHLNASLEFHRAEEAELDTRLQRVAELLK
jgi:serine/threonine protein kinase